MKTRGRRTDRATGRKPRVFRHIPRAGRYARRGTTAEGPRLDADGAVVAGIAVEIRDLDDIAGVRGVDELAAADVHALVVVAVEEDEVAGLEVRAVDRRAHAVLRGGVVRERDPDLRVGPHRQAGAVEALTRRRAGPPVRHAELRERRGHDGRATGRRRRCDRRVVASAAATTAPPPATAVAGVARVAGVAGRAG